MLPAAETKYYSKSELIDLEDLTEGACPVGSVEWAGQTGGEGGAGLCGGRERHSVLGRVGSGQLERGEEGEGEAGQLQQGGQQGHHQAAGQAAHTSGQ